MPPCNKGCGDSNPDFTLKTKAFRVLFSKSCVKTTLFQGLAYLAVLLMGGAVMVMHLLGGGAPLEGAALGIFRGAMCVLIAGAELGLLFAFVCLCALAFFK